jgi:hypothetical protein
VGSRKAYDHTLGTSPLPIIHWTLAVISHMFHHSLQFSCMYPPAVLFCSLLKIGYNLLYIACNTDFSCKRQPRSQLPAFARLPLPFILWCLQPRESIIFFVQNDEVIQLYMTGTTFAVCDFSGCQGTIVVMPDVTFKSMTCW